MLINCIRDRNHFFAVLLALPFFTVYIWSDQLVDGRYTAKTFYFYLISAIVFAGIALVLLFRKRPLQISFSKLDALIFIFYFYSFIRMLLTPNTPIANTRLLTHTLLLGLYFAWKAIFASSGKTTGISTAKILLLLLLLSGFGQIIYGLLQLYHIIPVPHNIGGFRVFGNFGNPSPYGSFLGPFLPLGLGAFLLIESEENIDRIIKYVGVITFILGLSLLPAVQSRSAILGSSGGILLILAVKYHLIEKSRYVLNRIWKRSVFYLLIVAIVILGSIGMYRVKKDSALGRLLQWKITAGMIADKPVFGHGYNTFGLYYHDYQASYFANGKGTQQEKMIAGNNKQAHNEYIEVLAELGGIGLFILLGIIGAIFREYLQKNHKDNKNGSIRTVLFSGLLAFLIISLFTFQLQILPSLVIFVFLISGIATVQRTNRKFILNTLPQRILSLGLLGLIAIFAFHQRNNFKAHKKWKTANLYSGMRSYDPAIKIYQELYPVLQNNGSFLLNYGGTLALDSLYQKALPVLQRAERYLNDPNLYMSLGNCYKETGDFEKAENYYTKAGNIVPHQMYPRYLLVKLYRKYDQNSKAIQMAQEIIDMKVKINSTAVSQIKGEMENFIKVSGHRIEERVNP